MRFIRSTAALLLFTLTLGVAHVADAQGQWQFESQRDEIAPRAWKDAQVLFEGKPTLALSGDGKSFADGRWARIVRVEPESFYRLRSHFLNQGVEEPHRSVLARLLWEDDQGKLIGPIEYPATVRWSGDNGWRRIEQTYRSPPQAAQARIELVYRWDPDGSVYFDQAQLEKVEAPAPRKVRLATVHYRPVSSRSLKENLDYFASLIAAAAAEGADIVCLPEALTLPGSGKSYVEVSEPVPGPTTAFFAELARTHRIYIVAGLIERDGPVVYNTAILLDREGALAGTYRKVSLPREEIDGGITPGDAFPVFDTDFGRIGIMICWDVSFPEPARKLALDGAEVIFMPIWGGNTTLARARAIENQVHLVSSSYDMETGVFDQEGELIGEATNERPFVVVEVDLNLKKDWPWLGDFRNRIPREMPPQRAFVPAPDAGL